MQNLQIFKSVQLYIKRTKRFTHITDLQTKLKIEQTEQGRIALVGCETMHTHIYSLDH
jgi:hypothetical protein